MHSNLLPFYEDNFLKYHSLLKKFHKNITTFDIHVHPLDVMNILSYKINIHDSEIFSVDNSLFKCITLDRIKNMYTYQFDDISNPKNNSLFNFFQKRIYNFNGIKVFKSYFNINEIDKILLMNVPIENTNFDTQSKYVYDMFSGDKMFYFTGSVPNFINDTNIIDYIKFQIDSYDIIGIKLHPNISNIDLTVSLGKKRLERIISSSSIHKLPTIIHCGKSLHLSNDAKNFADIKNFLDIYMGSDFPIILSHGGAYDISSTEFSDRALNDLLYLLEKFDNIFIDTAGLSRESLFVILNNVSIDRILFGSDALYHNPLLQQINILECLNSLKLDLENCYKKIISKNARSIFKFKH